MGEHHHHHGQVKNKRTLFFAFILTTIFALLEITTGWFLDSLALLGEGIHMFSDGINLLMAFIAVTIGLKAATKKNPFGFRRIETITAFLNGLALMVIPVFIFIEAIHRFTSPRDITGMNMLIVASIGLVINVIVAFMLFKSDQSSLNIRAAALHVLSDLLSSLSTIIAALLIMSLNWTIADPIVSAVVSITIFIGGFKITKEAFNVLMEGTPYDVDVDAIKEKILALDGIASIKDVKVWSITSEVNYIVIHVRTKADVRESDILPHIKEITEAFHLKETIQIEPILS